jgi:hypothetical protein
MHALSMEETTLVYGGCPCVIAGIASTAFAVAGTCSAATWYTASYAVLPYLTVGLFACAAYFAYWNYKPRLEQTSHTAITST